MKISSSRLGLRAVALTPLLFIFSAYCQTAPAPASAPAASASSTSEEVSVDLVAHDKKGATIRDLKASDFEISSSSGPVHIDDLHIVASGPGPGGAQLVSLVFAHDNPGYARNARNIADELLKTAPESGILFAVFRVDGRLRLLQEFTSDRAALTKAIDAATVNYDRNDDAPEKKLAADLKAGTGAQDQTLSKVVLAMLLDSQDIVRDPHTPPAIAALTAACRKQGVLPGRKTLVYFSSGLDWNVADPEMPAKVAEAAVRARVSIYSIDAEILDPYSTNALAAGQSVTRALALGSISTTTGGTAAGGVAGSVGEQVGRIQAGDDDSSGSRLGAICHATGGERVNDSGNIHKSVQRIVDDVLGNYTAYFVPPTQGERFRTIRLKTVRAGIAIETRGGYFPVHRLTSLAVPSFGEKLLGALAGPDLPTALQFHASLLRFENTANGSLSSVAIEVPVSQIEVKPDPAAKTYAAHVSVLAQVRDQSGAIVERYAADIPKDGPLDAQGQPQRGAVGFRRHFIAAPGQYVLETAAMDMNSGKIGAQRIKFEIPSAASGPALGDIVLVRQIEPGNGAADSTEPLHCAEGKVIPNLSAHLLRDANPAILLFFDVQPDASSAAKPALTLEVERDGNLLGSIPLTLHTNSAAPGAVRELAKIGTKSLRAGNYEMTVVLSQGDKSVQRKLSLTLE